MRYDW